MAVLLGTLDGLYRVPGGDFDRVEQVLEERSDAFRFDTVDPVFAHSGGDLFWSLDGESWSEIPTPNGSVTAVELSSDEMALYIGMYPPARLYVWQIDDAEFHGDPQIEPAWREVESFPEFEPVEQYDPDRDETPVVLEAGGRIHELRYQSDRSRLIAGLEPHGMFVSEDRGKTWTSRSTGLHKDVHDIEIVESDIYITATGQGLYRTTDGGQSWIRVDTSQTYFEYTFFQGVLVHEGTVYTAAATSSPGNWDGKHGANAVLLKSDNLGDTFTHVPYPGGPEEIILSWAVVDNRVIAGTMAQDWDKDGTAEARVLEQRNDGTWRTVCSVPAGVVSITPI